MRASDVEELRAQARHARQRLDLYRARAYGMRATSNTRLRELERAAAAADERLRHALENSGDYPEASGSSNERVI
jgi:PAS domain-containing protein